MAVLGVFMLLPFAWLFSMSFRTVRDAYQMPPSFLPPRLDFENYRAVLDSSVPFLQIYANSVEIAVLVTLGQLVTCTLAAFAFARLRFPGPRQHVLRDADRAAVPGAGDDHPDLSRLRAASAC